MQWAFQLFLGAEGTLEIITAAVVKLFPKPTARPTALVACDGPDRTLTVYSKMPDSNADTLPTFENIECLDLQMILHHVVDCTDPIADVHPAYCLIELSIARGQKNLDDRMEAALEAVFNAEEITETVLSASEAQKDALCAIRENLSEAKIPKVRRSNMTFWCRFKSSGLPASGQSGLFHRYAKPAALPFWSLR